MGKWKLCGWQIGLVFGVILAILNLFSLKLLSGFITIFGGHLYQNLFAFSSFFVHDTFFKSLFFIVLWTVIGLLLFHKNKIYRIIGYILIIIVLLPPILFLLVMLMLFLTGQGYT